MKPMQFSGRWVLITGASSGLGREMARILARYHHAHLVLVARREERLLELKRELEEAHAVSVHVITADLAEPGEAERVFEQAKRHCDLYGAILNAGVTHFGDWHELSWDGFRRMLDLNVTSVVRLSTLLLPYLESRAEEGGLLFVSSMAGLTPIPYQTAYSATKAFIVNFGCGLHHEMLPRGVSVTTFVPGGIATEMTEGPRFNQLRSWLMPVTRCAHEAIAAFQRRSYLHGPGFAYRVGNVASRLLPQRFLVAQIAQQYRRSLEKNR